MSFSGRFLIVNADDFGQTAGVNRGIIEAHERGIVTSASLMVRQSGAVEAAEYAIAHPDFSVGLHFELAEWRYVGGAWERAYELVDAGDGQAVRDEYDRQLTRFGELLRREPTHLDSHQHFHQREPTRSIMQESAERLHVPLRSLTSAVTHCGKFYGQGDTGMSYPQEIAPSHLMKLIQRLGTGWTEISCHPGYAEDLDSVYRAERELELRALCSEEVREELERQGVCLRSFHDLELKQFLD